MDKKRLLELAGVFLNEGPPKTTWDNPLVYVWDDKESKDYPESGLVGHMHLTTAQNIHRFKLDDLAEELKKAGVGKRIKAGSKWLELSDWTAKEIKAGGRVTEGKDPGEWSGRTEAAFDAITDACNRAFDLLVDEEEVEHEEAARIMFDHLEDVMREYQ